MSPPKPRPRHDIPRPICPGVPPDARLIRDHYRRLNPRNATGFKDLSALQSFRKDHGLIGGESRRVIYCPEVVVVLLAWMGRRPALRHTFLASFLVARIIFVDDYVLFSLRSAEMVTCLGSGCSDGPVEGWGSRTDEINCDVVGVS